jgi:short-subunit dehydrogenase
MVTGASAGIGEAFARQLAASGAHLVLVARRQDRLRALAAELERQHHVDAEVLVADLSQAEQRAAVERRLSDGGAPVDLLVNNAGGGRTGAVTDRSIDDLEAEAVLNAITPLRLAATAASAMVARGEGTIVNVSSGVGFYPVPGAAVYAAAKAFTIAIGEAMHEELRAFGVGVTTVCPGYTRTEGPTLGDVPIDWVPRLAWMEPDAVARGALRAARRGQALYSPGVVNKFAAGIGRHLPHAVVRTAGARATGVHRRQPQPT